jgi:arginine N-succinyltransferase
MLVLRPISNNDFAALKQVAIASGHGFTSLPVCDDLLSNKINRAVNSFNKQVNAPGDEGYLFVLEDTTTGEIVGTTAIEASVGIDVPLYHYHLGKTVHHSRTLGVYNTVDILSMCNDYTGATEICTLFLKETHRSGLAGRFLSRIRFLFMAEHSERFSNRVIAEMRGVSDQDGHSPFWQWLQEHFFSIDFPTADHLIGTGNKVFISELMPKHPIYANLLSKEAQAVIGKVHEKTKPALRLLEKEGFEFRGYVDLFDAGPTVEAQLNNIQSVKQSRLVTVNIGNQQSVDTFAINNLSIADFRAVFSCNIALDDLNDIATINQETADALNVTAGDSIRILKLS